ncbi:MAG: hypothetical protein OIF40_15360 [Mangrovicoccus sp.]|nr:hypothetical protein [Mangrovicoccus sp.]
MSGIRRIAGGSRFLLEPFEYSPKDFVEAHDRILNMKFEAIDHRLSRIEALMERLERRLWLTVYGVVATVLAQAFKTFLTIAPTGGF